MTTTVTRDSDVRNRKPASVAQSSNSSFSKTHPFLANSPNTPDSDGPVKATEALNEAMWRDVAEITKKQLCRRIDQLVAEDLQGMVNRVVDCTRLIETPVAKSSYQSVDWMNEKTRDKKHVREGDTLPEKVFMHRESVLTDLLQISHIRAVYHMFAAILILFALETVLSDYLEVGSFREKYHVEMCLWSFGQFPNTVAIWLFMQLCTLAVHPTFMFWAGKRAKTAKMTLVDWTMLWAYGAYQWCLMLFIGWLVFRLNLPPGSSILLGMELARFMMKTHAFVRSNAPKAFVYTRICSRSRGDSCCAHKNLDETVSSMQNESNCCSSHQQLCEMLETMDQASKMSSGSQCPSFSHYLYFLFAPTLVYRDAYPRTDRVRWSFVLSNGLQFLLCVMYTYFILFRFIMTKFEAIGARPMSWQEVARLILSCMIPGGMQLNITFFAFLHSWLNMFAELLRFGDRLFYKDWWNSRTFSTFYRTWNVVVHDWLYTYVYMDVFQVTKSRMMAMTLVFVISSYMHEYILCITFKYFFPVLLIMFGGAGFLLMFIKTRNRFWNLSFFTNLGLGVGIEMALYANEWYSRKNCPSMNYSDNFWLDISVPRSLFCNPSINGTTGH